VRAASVALCTGARRSQRGLDSGVRCPSSPVDPRISGLSPLPGLVPHRASQSHRPHFPLTCPKKDHPPPRPPPLHGVGNVAPLSHRRRSVRSQDCARVGEHGCCYPNPPPSFCQILNPHSAPCQGENSPTGRALSPLSWQCGWAQSHCCPPGG